MKWKSSFRLSEFTNPSGEIVFRISGWLGGKRIRRNFPTRAEANAERQILELRREQGDASVRVTATRLTNKQLCEAEVAFQRLNGRPHSLTFYLDYALANYREPAAQKLLSEAISEYVALKEHEREQDLLSESHLVHLKRELSRLQKHFPNITVDQITGPCFIEYLDAELIPYKTYNNRRGLISTFFEYACQREWLKDNPLSKFPPRRIRRRRGEADTLTAAVAAELMAYVEAHHQNAVPFFALCLFAGIRPCLRTGEILRLQPEHVNLATSVIHVGSNVSKVREPRNVVIQPNLGAWLRAYPLEKLPIISKNLQHVREKIGVRFILKHNVMRHTYISNFVAKFRSIGEAALQAGNSEAIIRKHYLNLKTAEEAEQFFGILPELKIPQSAASEI